MKTKPKKLYQYHTMCNGEKELVEITKDTPAEDWEKEKPSYDWEIRFNKIFALKDIGEMRNFIRQLLAKEIEKYALTLVHKKDKKCKEYIDKARKEGWNDCIKEYEKIKSATLSPMKILDEVKRRERQRVIGELENWINRDENWTIKQLKEKLKKIK